MITAHGFRILAESFLVLLLGAGEAARCSDNLVGDPAIDLWVIRAGH